MHTTETHLRNIYDKMLGDDFDDRKNARVAVVVMYLATVRGAMSTHGIQPDEHVGD